MVSAILLSIGRNLSLVDVFAKSLASEQVSIVVGYVDDAKQSGGGKFITRDSGLGDYGEVTYDWTRRHAYDLFWIELPDKAAETPKP